MHFFTSLTRMWLTRTVQPFTFRREYDQALPFAECESLGLYVHIPFCKSICNFCPYCKVRYSAELCERYIDSLIQEIHLVGGQHPGRKKATSLYFGGGTPALAANRIKEIVDALGEHFIITEGIGLELHPDNVTVETLQSLKEAGVTKISIGIQSFSDKYQKILGRKTVDTAAMAATLAAVPFETVSMDFIFALGRPLKICAPTSTRPSHWGRITSPSIRLSTLPLRTAALRRCQKEKSGNCWTPSRATA